VLGRSTVDNIRSGVLFGSLTEIEGMITLLSKELSDTAPVVVATGGLQYLLRDRTSAVHYFDDALVLKGINFVLQNAKR
jgi:type III pantothenate kinase